jgi:hypothetical protein
MSIVYLLASLRANQETISVKTSEFIVDLFRIQYFGYEYESKN